MSQYSTVYLLHGKGGSPEGSVSKLEALLAPKYPDTEFILPLLPHHDANRLAEESVEFLKQFDPKRDSLIIGISLGGLVAAKYQETARPDLTIICISSPTWADGVRLERKIGKRLSIYSSTDNVIAGRTAEWALADAHDLPWMTHDTDQHAEALVAIISNYIDVQTTKD
jgi:predicted esterase YcpF (UPF0227 family)